jgi:hypothetical protein
VHQFYFLATYQGKGVWYFLALLGYIVTMNKSIKPKTVWEIMNYEILIACGVGMILMVFMSIV